MAAQFREQGSVCDLPKSGRPRTARSDENHQRVAESVAEDPSTSVRRRSSQIGVSQSSLQRMLHEEGKFLYKIQLVQELQPNDPKKRMEYTMQFQDLANGDPNFLKNLMMFDEAHFHLNGFINKQTCRIWGSENPHATAQRQLPPQKCTVWCGVMVNEVIEPYFFENEEGENVTVTGARYHQMLGRFCSTLGTKQTTNVVPAGQCNGAYDTRNIKSAPGHIRQLNNFSWL